MNPMSKLLIAITFLILPLAACGSEALERGELSSYGSALVEVQGDECVPLLGGQHIDVGSVCATVEGDDLLVTYSTSGGWYLLETHLWVGLDLAGLPTTQSGNPRLGLFPYHSGDLEGETSYTATIPLSLFGLTGDMISCDPVELFIVSHAVVQIELEDGTFQTETAYGDGPRLTHRGNWATYFSIVLTCSDEDTDVGVGGSCETAFAFGDELATCFLDSTDISTSRWGWSNGPIGPGSYYFDIYAGAGQCDLSKGTLVGWLEVEYDGSAATVGYHMIDDFTMSETHLYVGSDPLPQDQNGAFTVAPGQYGNANELEDASHDSFVIEDLSGEIFVVAHAVVCS